MSGAKGRSLTVHHNTAMLLLYIVASFVLVVVTAYFYNTQGLTPSMMQAIIPWVTGLGMIITTLAAVYTAVIRAFTNHVGDKIVKPIVTSIDNLGEKVTQSVNDNAYAQYCLSTGKTSDKDIKRCVTDFGHIRVLVRQTIDQSKKDSETL